MEDKTKDIGAEEKGSIHEETECCADGSCCWNNNDSGGVKRSQDGGSGDQVTPPQSHARAPPGQFRELAQS